MTRAPEPKWYLVTHDGTLGGHWRDVLATDDAELALAEYKGLIAYWPASGGVRLYSPKGLVHRYAGILGKPGSEVGDES